MTEQQLSQLSWEELLTKREKLLAAIEELEAEKSVLSDEFLTRLKDENISGKVIGNWSISKATRISFAVTIDQAREFGAVKEAIDQAILKKQYLQGANVPGIKRTEYAMVREVEQDHA